jgi:TolB-like protein/lipopolysaccharide biosynthesis regulator YciM
MRHIGEERLINAQLLVGVVLFLKLFKIPTNMSASREPLFFRWIKKRKYINLSLVYLGSALVVVHFAEMVIHGLHMPDITFSLLIVLALAGLPIVLLASWAFDLNKPTLKRGRPPKHSTAEAVHPQPEGAAVWVRRIGIVVLCMGIFAMAIMAYNRFLNHPKFTGKEKSIAVLPFSNMSGDKNNEYFSDGMTQDIINQVGKISGLRVIGWNTVRWLKDEKRSIQEIAQVLKVASILGGSVEKYGNSVRIRVELTDANTNESIWATSYDRDIKDIFSIQSMVAQQVANELRARLSKEEKSRLESKPTDNLEAYDLFLKGKYAQDNYSSAGLQGAETFYKQAIAKDPHFREAYSYLANLYSTFITWAGNLPAAEGKRKVMNILNQVLPGDTLTMDFITLSGLEFNVNKDSKIAEHYLQRALQLDPKSHAGNFFYGHLLMYVGRHEEAEALFNKCREISPLNLSEYSGHGENYYAWGRYDDAAKTFKEGINLFPSTSILYNHLSRVYLAQERYAEAINTLLAGFSHSVEKPPSMFAYLAVAYFKTGQKEKARVLMEELKQQDKQRAAKGEKVIDVYIAQYYSAINDKDEAFHFLEQAIANNDVELVWLKKDPIFNNLHGDPRYLNDLSRIGFSSL